MNRTILIVICDFLLVSMLAFSTVDIDKVTETSTTKSPLTGLATNQASSGKDLAAVMRQSLDEERRNRDRLLSELEKTRATAGQQQALLSEREKQVQAARQELATREQNARELQEQLASAQTNLQTLGRQLQSRSTEAVMSREQVSAMEAELRKQNEQAAALQRQLADLARSNQLAVAEKQRLAGELQVAEVEKRHAAEQAARAEQQVQVERAEKAKLAEGVNALASKSTELVTEIRENRPLAPNNIFNDFVSNRVNVQITASRPGAFSEATRRKDAVTVFATDGTNTFALCHVEETPLVLFNPGTDWQQLTGTFARASSPSRVPIRSLSFQFRDPRIVWMPVSAADAKAVGAKVYRLSSDPFKFQDAVLVGANEGYYGECRFEIDLTTPDHVRLDRSVLKGMFGKFNPSRGDLVFSKHGELLGVMANNTYCMMVRTFDAGATLPFDENIQNRAVGRLLADLAGQVRQMPLKLQ
jgi:hypothetical protein